jgi:hypothetical protein
MQDLAIFCADIGSVKGGNFGWARTEPLTPAVVVHYASSPADLATAVDDELDAGRPVALGFECPLFVSVPADHASLGAKRAEEGNRPWSASADATVLTTGLVQVPWVLAAIRERRPDDRLHVEWSPFADEGRGLLLLLWEAFVSGAGKDEGASHVDDATKAVTAFVDSLPDPATASSVTAERPLSLAAAAALWSGWIQDPEALHGCTLVIRT